MPSDEPITAQLLNGQPSRPGWRSCMPTSKKRALSTAANPRQDAKRFKGTVVKGEKRMKTITLEDNINVNIRPFKRPVLLGPSSGNGVGGASTSSSA